MRPGWWLLRADDYGWRIPPRSANHGRFGLLRPRLPGKRMSRPWKAWRRVFLPGMAHVRPNLPEPGARRLCIAGHRGLTSACTLDEVLIRGEIGRASGREGASAA